MREWMETRVGENGLKLPVQYSVPEDLPEEVFRRHEEDPFRCVATKKNGQRCKGSPAPGGGYLTLCPVHIDRVPHMLFAVTSTRWRKYGVTPPLGRAGGRGGRVGRLAWRRRVWLLDAPARQVPEAWWCARGSEGSPACWRKRGDTAQAALLRGAFDQGWTELDRPLMLRPRLRSMRG